VRGGSEATIVMQQPGISLVSPMVAADSDWDRSEPARKRGEGEGEEKSSKLVVLSPVGAGSYPHTLRDSATTLTSLPALVPGCQQQLLLSEFYHSLGIPQFLQICVPVVFHELGEVANSNVGC
jgi:hypothetical protein